MIRHVVVWQFVPEFVGEARSGLIELLRSLPQHIDVVRSLTVGEDLVSGPSSFELGLVVDFDSLQDLDAYVAHPKHQEVLSVTGPVRTSLAIVDFAF